MSEYPEHEKLTKISDQSQAIGEFLDWLGNSREQPMVLCVYSRNDTLLPTLIPTQKLLAEFFEIDLKRLESEKVQMLQALREVRT